MRGMTAEKNAHTTQDARRRAHVQRGIRLKNFNDRSVNSHSAMFLNHRFTLICRAKQHDLGNDRIDKSPRLARRIILRDTQRREHDLLAS
jgi:hypothetical protein